MSKKIIYILLFVSSIVYAQSSKEYTHALDGIEWVKIESSADIIVKTHSSNQLLIKGGHPLATPKKAEGLKLVGQGGTDNTNVGFHVSKKGNVLVVQNLRKSKSAQIYLPASQNLSAITNWSGDIEISGFLGEVEASARLNGGVTIRNVSGPLTANSLNGGVEVLFTKVSQKSPITIFSTNGALDVTMPKNTPADLSLGSTNGAIYTNFELNIPDKNGLRAIAAKSVRGSVNNGGVKIKLNTTNGNIYLRKQ